jgi:hypothetical protein
MREYIVFDGVTLMIDAGNNKLIDRVKIIIKPLDKEDAETYLKSDKLKDE